MRTLALVTLLALAGCGSGRQPQEPSESPSAAVSAAPAPSSAPVPSPSSALAPTPRPSADAAALDSRDCRTVAQAYAAAVARNDFAFAARAWNDPAIDAARLAALFTGYGVPQIEIGSIRQEGAAGSLYCTVDGTLTDVADSNKPPRKGEIVLRRVNDVPGATPEQLRWTIRSSTFLRNLQRSG